MNKWKVGIGAALIVVAAAAGGDARKGHGGANAAPDKLIERLVEGNRRFVKNEITRIHSLPEERAALAKGQQPFAIVVGCADSRVSPELVFDHGLGQLFVVRTAGQVLDAPALGSIEYAAEHLGSSLIVVLGHEKCGAVKAAVDGGEAPGHIGSLVEAIAPAVEHARGMPGDLLRNAVRANVERVAGQLRHSAPILAELVEHGKLNVTGAVYDLASGRVEFLD